MKKTFEITKDFGEKTLEKVFVKEDSSFQTENGFSLTNKIASSLENCQSVCIVAENAFSDELMNLLYEARQKLGCRIYAIVKNLESSSFEKLKNNCIAREVSEISGNYLICDKSLAFFFDKNLNGYEFKNPETVSKLHDFFIYNFWNNAKKEFVSEVKDVAEQTFDVAPVEGNNNFILDRSALEPKPYQKLLEDSDTFVVQSKVPDFFKNLKSSNSTIYLDKKACEKSRDWILKTSGKNVKFAENNTIPLCYSDGNWFVLNNNFESPSNSGNFLAVKKEGELALKNVYSLKDSFSFREAVGKQMFYAKDFSPISVVANDSEECSVSYDYKKCRQIVKMSDEERKSFFENENLLSSEKLALEVKFTITMENAKLSSGAKSASIYSEYDKFKNQYENSKEKIKKEISVAEKKIAVSEDDFEKLNKTIEDLNSQISKADSEIAAKEAESEKSNKDGNVKDKKKKDDEFGKRIKKLQEEKKKLNLQQAEIKKRIESKNSDLKQENEKLKQNKKLISLLDETKILEPKTVAECKTIAEILKDFKFSIPRFDFPRYGTLYETKNGYEYTLNSETDLENAEAEMQQAKLENVRFVEKS